MAKFDIYEAWLKKFQELLHQKNHETSKLFNFIWNGYVTEYQKLTSQLFDAVWKDHIEAYQNLFKKLTFQIENLQKQHKQDKQNHQHLSEENKIYKGIIEVSKHHFSDNNYRLCLFFTETRRLGRQNWTVTFQTSLTKFKLFFPISTNIALTRDLKITLEELHLLS